MAVAFVAGMTTPSGFAAAQTLSNAIGFTTTSGAGNLLAVAFLFPADPGAFGPVTYGGVAMTAAGARIVNTSAVAIYYLLNPGAGNLTLAASWANSVANSWIAGEFSGVNTTTPVTNANYTTNTGSGTAESITVPTTSGDAAFGAYANGGVGTEASHTQTELANGAWVGGSGAMAAGYGLAPGSSVAFSWSNYGSASAWAAAGIDIVAASGGGGGATDDIATRSGAGAVIALMRERASGLLEPVRDLIKPRRRRLLVPGFRF